MRDDRTALLFVLPFVAVYGLLFVYPTLQMIALSFTNSQLIVPGRWVGIDNYITLFHDRRFGLAVTHTAWFVLLTVIPSTIVGLLVAMMISRLKGWVQGVALALFFLPYVLPVATVTTIWNWMGGDNGPLQWPIFLLTGQHVRIFATVSWIIPMVALLTVWWTSGFNILLFLAGLRNIPPELYEAAKLDGAGRLKQFRFITLPLIWPVGALVLTIQLILEVKLFDQLYLASRSDQTDPTIVLVQYIYNLGFQGDRGGYASTVAVALFAIVIIVSALQLQLLRLRGYK